MSKKDKTKISKTPRLYVEAALKKGEITPLSPALAHYLRNVLRQGEGDTLRLFNGRDGEWRATLTAIDKKSARAVPQEQIAGQPDNAPRIHLLFAPIKKTRLEWLIEKAVELGATDLHPVLTQNTEMRHLNTERLVAQIIGAAEQCERLDVPALHPLRSLDEALQDWDKTIPLYAALERADMPLLSDMNTPAPCAVLIGPEGGFTAEEKDRLLANPAIQPVSLGPRILRAETAALYVLSQI